MISDEKLEQFLEAIVTVGQQRSAPETARTKFVKSGGDDSQLLKLLQANTQKTSAVLDILTKPKSPGVGRDPSSLTKQLIALTGEDAKNTGSSSKTLRVIQNQEKDYYDEDLKAKKKLYKLLTDEFDILNSTLKGIRDSSDSKNSGSWLSNLLKGLGIGGAALGVARYARGKTRGKANAEEKFRGEEGARFREEEKAGGKPRGVEEEKIGTAAPEEATTGTRSGRPTEATDTTIDTAPKVSETFKGAGGDPLIKGGKLELAGSAGKSLAKIAGKGLSKALGPVSLILSGYEAYSDMEEAYGMWQSGQSTKQEFEKSFATILGGLLSGVGGAVLGGSLGAAAGSLVAPGPGTVVGGLIGSLAGGFAGSDAGEKLTGQLFDAVAEPDKERIAKNQAAAQAIATPTANNTAAAAGLTTALAESASAAEELAKKTQANTVETQKNNDAMEQAKRDSQAKADVTNAGMFKDLVNKLIEMAGGKVITKPTGLAGGEGRGALASTTVEQTPNIIARAKAAVNLGEAKNRTLGTISSTEPGAIKGYGGFGSVSGKYESSGDYSQIGNDKTGGFSYGKYQLASQTGSVGEFIKSLSTSNPAAAAALQAAGGESAAKAGSPEFQAAWKKLSADPDFQKSQEQYIKSQYFDKAAPGIAKLGVDVNDPAIQEAVNSTAVQHGVGGSQSVFKNALQGKDVASMSNKDIIDAVYAERGADSGKKYFGSSTASVRSSVVNRFGNEQKDLDTLEDNYQASKASAPASIALNKQESMQPVGPPAPVQVELAQKSSPGSAGAASGNGVLPPPNLHDLPVVAGDLGAILINTSRI